MSRSPAPVVAPSTVASCRASSRGSGPRTSRARASTGSVVPWRRRVPTVTTRAITTSSARRRVSSGRVRGRRERHDAAHARPGADDGAAHPLPTVLGLPEPQGAWRGASRPAAGRGRWRAPRGRRGGCGKGELTLADGVEQARDLQADEKEDGVLEHEGHARPVDLLREAGGGGLQLRRPVGEEESGRDDGQHPARPGPARRGRRRGREPRTTGRCPPGPR